MAAAPDAATIITDVLFCMGIGLLLATLRDAVGILLGNGRVLCFIWDVLAFVLAAVLLCSFAAGQSAVGVVRWYMAGGMAAGACGWYLGISQALHATLALLCKIFLAPLRLLEKHRKSADNDTKNTSKSENAVDKTKINDKKGKKSKKSVAKATKSII